MALRDDLFPGSSRPLVVWCAGVSWNGVTGTDRQMVTALSPYADVLWVDPPVSVLTPARYRYGASRWPVPTIEHLSESLIRLSPKAMPLHTRGPLRSVAALLVRQQIRYVLRRIGRLPHACVTSHLDDLLGYWGQQALNVFFGTDDYVGGADLLGTDRKRLEREERRQLRRADIVVAISSELVNRWRGLGFKGRMELIPNGVNAEHYRDIDKVAPAGVALPRPIAGFVGNLSSRIDIGLLESVIEAGCSLLLVGPHNPAWEPERFKAIVSNPRVSWVGGIEFAKLSSYLAVIDVGVTPYADTEFNRASFPLKTLEYLAAGKPVVSTDLPAVRWLDTDLITVATRDAFGEAALEAATAVAEPAAIQRRVAFAAAHSWDRRARSFAQAIEIASDAARS